MDRHHGAPRLDAGLVAGPMVAAGADVACVPAGGPGSVAAEAGEHGSRCHAVIVGPVIPLMRGKKTHDDPWGPPGPSSEVLVRGVSVQCSTRPNRERISRPPPSSGM